MPNDLLPMIREACEGWEGAEVSLNEGPLAVFAIWRGVGPDTPPVLARLWVYLSNDGTRAIIHAQARTPDTHIDAEFTTAYPMVPDLVGFLAKLIGELQRLAIPEPVFDAAALREQLDTAARLLSYCQAAAGGWAGFPDGFTQDEARAWLKENGSRDAEMARLESLSARDQRLRDEATAALEEAVQTMAANDGGNWWEMAERFRQAARKRLKDVPE
jgi:hypothetical protein